jgi:DNA-binding GntR family transcriptional regulator
MNDERVRTLLDRLRDHYGDGFDTAITTGQVEPAARRLLADLTDTDLADLAGEQTLHYGQEKSRNPEAFADADAGYVYGCMDPGDDMILDALAELELDAKPATAETEDGETVRAKGRGFDGPDADTAQALLASVRENHVAQAAGRYARDPDDPESGAVAYVHTDATPTGFVDLETPGVEWLPTDLQRDVIDALAARPSATVREIADAVECSKEHVRETLQRLEAEDLVGRVSGAGDHGADVYQGDDADGGLVDLAFAETTNDRLCNHSRWSLAIWDRHAVANGPLSGSDGSPTGTTPADGADPPPGSDD